MDPELKEYLNNLILKEGDTDENYIKNHMTYLDYHYFLEKLPLIYEEKISDHRWYTSFYKVVQLPNNDYVRYHTIQGNEYLEKSDILEYIELDKICYVFPKEVIKTIYVTKEEQ